MTDIIKIFGVLAHEGRYKMLAELAKNKRKTVSELGDACGMSPSIATRTLNDFTTAGLVDRERVKGRTYYTLRPDILVEALQQVAEDAALPLCGKVPQPGGTQPA